MSKQSLLTVGALLDAVVAAQPVTAAHASNLSHTDSYSLTNPTSGQVSYSHQHYDPSQSSGTGCTGQTCGEGSCHGEACNSEAHDNHTDVGGSHTNDTTHTASHSDTTVCSSSEDTPGTDPCIGESCQGENCGSGESTSHDNHIVHDNYKDTGE